MPFFSSIAARNEYAPLVKGGKTLPHVMAEAAMNRDPDDDKEVRPHDRQGRPLDDNGQPIEADDDVYDDDYDESDDDDVDVPHDEAGRPIRTQKRHRFGDAAEMDGHGHGGVPRAQLYDPHHPQPQDAGTLSTPRSGALANSVSCNPADVQVQQLDYRVTAQPTVTFPHAPLAQPAEHTAPTSPTGGKR